MLTRTLPDTLPTTPSTPQSIQKTVDERGFYLYEWLTPDELRMTLDRDYLQIVRWASIPLAVVTLIAGFLGFAWGVIGLILAVLWVLGIFYTCVISWLTLVFLRRAYLYTRHADVAITDTHYVTGHGIIEKSATQDIESQFEKIERIFDERFLWESTLAERKKHAQKALIKNLKEVALWWGKIMKNIWRSRDSGAIVMVVMVAWVLYSIMMGVTYFFGLFFIAILGRVFWWMAHRYLLAMNQEEYTIQALFNTLDEKAKKLQTTKETNITLLSEAEQNAWKDNLSGKINDSLTLLSDLAKTSTDESQKLRALLESSKYREVFNFVKYGNWVKKQILEPIESILLLLETNHATIERTIISLDSQISTTTDPSLQKPLVLQKERLILQKKSFERNITLLKSYQEKLTI